MALAQAQSDGVNDALSLGTGITAILLHNLPYQFKGLNVIAIMIFVLNVVLFCTFTIM